MNKKTGVQFEGKETYVKNVFHDIADVYDKMNNIMTFGMVKGWQKKVVKYVGAHAGGNYLDVGAGTGEISFMLAEKAGAQGAVTGLDLSVDMLNVAREKMKTRNLPIACEFVEGNALNLPFADNTFDGVTSGFTIRNVTDFDKVISEMMRVIKPGKKVVVLEIARPKNKLFGWGFNLYFGKVVPFLGHFFDHGKSIQGRQPAYTWLRDSFTGFPYGEDMADIFRSVGLEDVKFYAPTLGVVNIYEGTKPLT